MAYDSSVVVPLPADETFALITEPARLRRWNSVAARIDLRAGGDYRWTIIPGKSVVGVVREVEPGKRLVIGWGPELPAGDGPDPSTVEITLEPTHDGTIVRLVHRDLPADQEAGHAAGWDHYLARLVAAGTDGDAGPDRWVGTISDLDELDEQKSAEATLAIVQRVLRQITTADETNPTPCSEYTVAQVVEHLTRSIRGIGGLAAAAFPEAQSGDLEADVADLAQPALEAWARRGTDGTVDAGIGAIPAAAALGIFSLEFLVHAWDLATASGQKMEVHDDLAGYVLGLSKRVIDDDLRAKAGFDPEIAPAADANNLEKLLALTGRAA
jgi:uncharacterized protein (TIGR03086 family)